MSDTGDRSTWSYDSKRMSLVVCACGREVSHGGQCADGCVMDRREANIAAIQQRQRERRGMTDKARKSTGNRYLPIVAALCRAEGWPEPVAEQRLIPGRRFSCDLVWLEARLVCEVQGGVWLRRGGHTGGQAQIDDMCKLNMLQLLGYKVLLVTPQQVTDGTLQALLATAFRLA